VTGHAHRSRPAVAQFQSRAPDASPPLRLRLFELLNAHLRRQQRAGALLERRFGPREPGLQ
jgi:hypothetical protein